MNLNKICLLYNRTSITQVGIGILYTQDLSYFTRVLLDEMKKIILRS